MYCHRLRYSPLGSSAQADTGVCSLPRTLSYFTDEVLQALTFDDQQVVMVSFRAVLFGVLV